MAFNALLERMLECRDESQVEGLMRFFKTGPGQYGEGDKFLGIKVPVTRAVVKECWKDVSFGNLEECLLSPYHEVRLAGLLCLVEIFSNAGKSRPSGCAAVDSVWQAGSGKADGKAGMNDDIWLKLQRRCVDFYLAHTDRINNWDLVDLSCYSLLGEWLLDKDRTLLYDLAGNGKNIWEKRIGIVSTMAFVRRGELSDTYAISDLLLSPTAPTYVSYSGASAAESVFSASGASAAVPCSGASAAVSSSGGSAPLHDLLQKAVGWLLREAGKKDEASLRKFLDKRASIMPRTMLRYAIEKFSPELRAHYLQK